jgi:uncharacterized protein (DUF1697 family)
VRYVALLRGINVGGNHMVPMAALKSCFEAQRLRDVATYIQSGNVVFTAAPDQADALTPRIERALQKTFAFPIPVVIRSADDMRRIVGAAPNEFGSRPETYRYDVIFLKAPLTTDEAMPSVSLKAEVDQVWAGQDVLYFSRLVARAPESQLTRLLGKPVYRSMTIRNWNTTTKLAGLVAT